MDTNHLGSFGDVLDFCYANEHTLYLLKKPQTSSQVVLVTLDILGQTFKSSHDLPLFEGVQADDQRYHVLSHKDRVIVVYPNNVLVVYQDRRLLTVVQSIYNVDFPTTVGDYLVFVDQPVVKPTQPSNDHDRIMFVAFENLEEIGKKAGAKGSTIVATKSPFKSGTALVTDIKRSSPEGNELIIAFNNGKLWLVDPLSQQPGSIFGLDTYPDQLGQLKPYQFNCVDLIFVRELGGTYIILGDTTGRLTVVKRILNQPLRFIFSEQVSYNQIIACKWVSASFQLIFAFITSDGSLLIQRVVQPNGAQKGELRKLGQVSIFEEVANQFNFASQHLKQSQFIQFSGQTMCVLWPERLVYKINKRTAEKKALLEKKLSLFKLFDSHLPLSQLGGMPLVSSQMVPREIEDLVPEALNAQLVAEPYAFLIAKDEFGASLLNVYQNFDGKKKELINITKSSGLLPDQLFVIQRLEVRPRVLQESPTYKFLVQIQNNEAEATGMSLVFNYDMQTQKLAGNVQQFYGINSLFIGSADQFDPVLVSIMDDQKTLQFFPFDSKLEVTLPAAPVSLLSKIKSMYWTPFCNGMTILYESIGESQLRFSKNRLESNQAKDFQILAQTKYSMKLQFDEKVFDVQWTGYLKGDPKNIRGAVSTNHAVYLVDANLGVLSSYSLTSGQLVTSLCFLGSTVIFSTERHLYYMTPPSKLLNTTFSGLITSFTTKCLILGALSDRLTLLTSKGTILTKSVPLLEPLLLGYLTSTHTDLHIVRRCLQYLDSQCFSQSLLSALQSMKMANAAQFIVSNCHVSPGQVEVMDRIQIMKALGQDVIEVLTPGNPDLIVQKLKNEVDFAFERDGVRKEGEAARNDSRWNLALKCAEIMQDARSAVEIAECTGKVKEVIKAIPDGFKVDQTGAIIKYLTKKHKAQIKVSNLQRFSLPEDHVSPWDLNLDLPQDIKLAPSSVALDVPINRLNLGYNEAPFSFKTPLMANSSFPVHSVVSDNLGNWLGYDSLIADGANQAQVFNMDQPLHLDKIGEVDRENLDIQLNVEDFDERQYCVMYWRFDEGKGEVVTDMTDNEVNGNLGGAEWSDDKLPDGEPIEYEDKWGKQNVPSYSVELDGFRGDYEGIKTSISPAVMQKFKMQKSFTLEFWFQLQSKPTDNSLLTLINTKDLSIELTTTSLVVNAKPYSLHSSPLATVPILTWSHLSLSASLTSLTLSSDCITLLTLPSLASSFPKSPLSLFTPFHLRLSLTECRLWSICLPISLLKAQLRQPLGFLYEQKRLIKIKINKGGAGGAGLKKPSGAIGGAVGLKLVSQLDKKKKALQEMPTTAERIKEETQMRAEEKGKEERTMEFGWEVENDSKKPKVPDGFVFGFETYFQSAQKEEAKQQSSSFDFFGGFESQQVSQSQAPHSIQADSWDFGQEAQQKDSLQQFQDFNDFSGNPQQTPVQTEINAFQTQNTQNQQLNQSKNFQSTPEKQNNTVASSEEKKEKSPSPSQTLPSAVPIKISKAKITLNKSQNQQTAIIKRVSSHAKDIDQVIDSLVKELAESKLAEAEALVNEGMQACREMVGLQDSEEKEKLKKGIRYLVNYKLALKVSVCTAQLKHKVGMLQAQALEQKDPLILKELDNIQSQLASLSNLLVILQLPSSNPQNSAVLKKSYLQLALNHNIRLKNFSAVSKLVAFYRKQVPEDAASEAELSKISQIEVMCQKYENKNLSGRQGYDGADCPSCSDPLTFGLATSQCHKCKKKIGVCFMTLRPLVAEEATKCQLCLARFAPEWSHRQKEKQAVLICPICNLAKI